MLFRISYIALAFMAIAIFLMSLAGHFYMGATTAPSGVFLVHNVDGASLVVGVDFPGHEIGYGK